MAKEKLVFYASLIILGYVFLPIISMNISIPGKWFISVLLLIVSVLISYPSIVLKKEMILLISFSIIYFFLAPITDNIQEIDWLKRRFIPLTVGVIISLYYLRIPYDFKRLRILFWFTIYAVIISCLTTIIGMVQFPNASRELASSVYGNIEMTKLYQRIGIVGYGFITALIYIAPIIVLLYKNSKNSLKKLSLLIMLLVILFTALKAQYTTQLLLLLTAVFITLFGVKMFQRRKWFVISILFFFALIPSYIYVDLLKVFADIIPGDVLKVRIEDMANTIEYGSVEDSGTHVGDRVSRIPFLISEFFKSPIIGGGESTGHVYWLDHLSLYGIVGIIPWIFLLKIHYVNIKKRLSDKFLYYQVAFWLFIALGFMKGSGNREQFIILFFILPAGLILYENGEIFKKKYEIIK